MIIVNNFLALLKSMNPLNQLILPFICFGIIILSVNLILYLFRGTTSV